MSEEQLEFIKKSLERFSPLHKEWQENKDKPDWDHKDFTKRMDELINEVTASMSDELTEELANELRGMPRNDPKIN